MISEANIIQPDASHLQPQSIRCLNIQQRDELITSMRKVDGKWLVVSRYADDIWWLVGAPTNVTKAMTKLDFLQIPTPFRAIVKEMLYRLKTRGRIGRKQGSVSHLVKTLHTIGQFLHYAACLKIWTISEISPLVCSSYVQHCKLLRPSPGSSGLKSKRSEIKPRSSASLFQLLVAVETIYELSQYTDDPMLQHPWPDSSANRLSNYGRNRRTDGNTTPLMSDQVFTSLFQKAWSMVQSAEDLLDLRDEMETVAASHIGCTRAHVNSIKNLSLKRNGWDGGVIQLVANLMSIRTACYIVIASLSGCRHHEMSFLQRGSYYRTEDDQGEQYWWMRSISTKTDEGSTEWMIPEAAVTALRIMDRWVAPYQAQLQMQIEAYRMIDPEDLRIADAQEHLNAIFVGADKARGNQIRTLSLTQSNNHLRAFAGACGLDWKLASHQFRRKFANYAARSRFGDLRYLREHFKHWSFDMTVGYALNESQEMALYMEIEDELEDIKQGVVAGWLDKSTPLAGGYGNNLANWRSREENITLFKSHAHMLRSIAESTAIRSNGHAWCTADDNLCDGNDVNPTRCAGGGIDGRGCSSAVIGPEHASTYVGLYEQLKILENCEDIGTGGQKRVARDLERCRSVLTTLGHDPLKPIEA
jgi:hypothetical protein